MNYMRMLRQYVGTSPIILAGSAVIILNDKGEILLQKRVDDGLWGIPGGGMELGDSFEETAIKEVKEETGLTIKSMKLFSLFSGKEYYHRYPHGDECYNALAVYICDDYEGELYISDGESSEQQFWSLHDLPELSSITKKVLTRYLE
jgi:mutator protein MutT